MPVSMGSFNRVNGAVPSNTPTQEIPQEPENYRFTGLPVILDDDENMVFLHTDYCGQPKSWANRSTRVVPLDVRSY